MIKNLCRKKIPITFSQGCTNIFKKYDVFKISVNIPEGQLIKKTIDG